MGNAEKFTRRDVQDTINRLKIMKFFPSDEAAQGAIAELLARICPHREALEWLVRTLLDRVPEWPGAYEVRAVLCTKYDAADGLDAYCSLPGFRPADCEAKAYDAHQQIKAGGWDKPSEEVQKLAAAHDMKRIAKGKTA